MGTVAPMGVKFGMQKGIFGPLLHAKFHPHRCKVSPLQGEKSENRPLSNLNNWRFVLRAMLPVNKLQKTARQCSQLFSVISTVRYSTQLSNS